MQNDSARNISNPFAVKVALTSFIWHEKTEPLRGLHNQPKVTKRGFRIRSIWFPSDPPCWAMSLLCPDPLGIYRKCQTPVHSIQAITRPQGAAPASEPEGRGKRPGSASFHSGPEIKMRDAVNIRHFNCGPRTWFCIWKYSRSQQTSDCLKKQDTFNFH